MCPLELLLRSIDLILFGMDSELKYVETYCPDLCTQR